MIQKYGLVLLLLVNILLGLVMVAFAAVQYNDPDALLWIVIYLVPAAWAFAAAFRLERVRSGNLIGRLCP